MGRIAITKPTKNAVTDLAELEAPLSVFAGEAEGPWEDGSEPIIYKVDHADQLLSDYCSYISFYFVQKKN